jgi:predicted enzyme related to lactoylglutathione lyase
MTTRSSAPAGVPCWADLFTSDVAGSRTFYPELFGWRAEEPAPEFGGYFMFTRNGVPVAGAMGDMGDLRADNTWKIYLATENIAETLERAQAEGAQLLGPAMAVADLGRQALLADPTGAAVGLWQPGTFPGFTVLDEPGTPNWFELYTRDFPGALDFYRAVLGWDLTIVGDSDEFRYATAQNPHGPGEIAGIMDATSFLPEGARPYWSVYWAVESAAASAARVAELGGSIVMPAQQTPYGEIAAVTDPSGAQFRLRAG